MNLIKYLPRPIREAHDVLKRVRPFAERTCPICEYQGFFKNAGRPPRIDAMCPSCRSMERHRLFWLWYNKYHHQIRTPILHFAAESVFESIFRKTYGTLAEAYKTSDLFAPADLKLNIEQLELPDASFSTIICNHVLEHVDDRKALAEIHRVLAPDGIFIVSVPLIDGWHSTYENPGITDPQERDLHFGQHDHVRFYGSDFRHRLADAGFNFEEITAEGSDVIQFSLSRGGKFFVCRK